MELNSIFSLIGVAVSAISTGVTAWMAVETRRMSTAAAESLQLERSPILGFRDFKVEVVTGVENQAEALASPKTNLVGIRVGVELFNAGRVPIRYKMLSFRVTFAGRTTDSETFMSRHGRILPGGSVFFWYPTLPLDPPIAAFPATGLARFSFTYSDESNSSPQSIIETVEYTVGGAEPGSSFNWMYVDEPLDSYQPGLVY